MVNQDLLLDQSEATFKKLIAQQISSNESVEPIVMSLLRQLDRLVSETAGCDSFIQKFVIMLEQLINSIAESNVLK